MKSPLRLVLALLAILLAGGVVYLGSQQLAKPLEKVEVIVAAVDIPKNTRITDAMVSKVYRSKDALNANSVVDAEVAIGKYAEANIYAEDIINAKDLVDAADTFDNYVLQMEVGKEAFAVPVENTAEIVAAHIAKGDIVKIYSYDEENEVSTESPYVQYVKVIGIFDGSGNEIADTSYYEDSKYLPSTIVLEVNSKQVEVLNTYLNQCGIHFSLVARSNEATIDAYLATQENVFNK